MIEAVLACIASALFGAAIDRVFDRQRQLRAAPVNWVQEMMLPEMDDPRWRSNEERWFKRLELGSVRVNLPYLEMEVAGVALSNDRRDVRRYAEAVVRAYAAREAMLAIEGAE